MKEVADKTRTSDISTLELPIEFTIRSYEGNTSIKIYCDTQRRCVLEIPKYNYRSYIPPFMQFWQIRGRVKNLEILDDETAFYLSQMEEFSLAT